MFDRQFKRTSVVLVVVLLATASVPTLALGVPSFQRNRAIDAPTDVQDDVGEVSVERLTVQRLRLRSVTIQNATFKNITGAKVLTPTGVTFVTQNGTRTVYRKQQNVTQATVRVDRISNVTGVLTNATMRNVTIRNESVAEAIFGNRTPEGNVTLQNLTLQNRTIDDLIVNQTLVDSVNASNVRLIDKSHYQSVEREEGPPAVQIGFASAGNATFRNVTVQVGRVRPNETEPSRGSKSIVAT